jgi:hypothetical protein
METKPRVFVTSDIHDYIGGEYDDLESFAHLVLYSHLYEIVGFSCSVPKGTRKAAINLAEAYERDHKAAKGAFRKEFDALIDPQQLKKRIWLGQSNTLLSAPASRGVKELVLASRRGPLYVLVWGAATDLAVAMRNGLHPENCMVHVIGSWNRQQDPHAYDIVQGARKSFRTLIMSNSTFRGIYYAASSNGRAGSKGFLDWYKENGGQLGKCLVDTVRRINSGAIFKAGDSGSIEWLIDEVTGRKPRFGGLYPFGTDSGKPEHKLAGFDGARTISDYRARIMTNLIRRVETLYGY